MIKMIFKKNLGLGLTCVLISIGIAITGCDKSKHQAADNNHDSDQLVNDDQAQGNYQQSSSSGESGGVATNTEALEGSEVIIENTYRDQYGNIVYTIVDQKPSFEGGKEALYSFLKENLQYPSEAIENQAAGTVHVAFVVGKNGAIRDVELGNGVANASLNKEAMRVVSEMPNWIPGIQNGEEVDAKYTIPIKFELQ
jgi:TonB family protein